MMDLVLLQISVFIPFKIFCLELFYRYIVIILYIIVYGCNNYNIIIKNNKNYNYDTTKMIV